MPNKKIIDVDLNAMFGNLDQAYAKGLAQGQVILARIILMDVNHAYLTPEQKVEAIKLLCEDIGREAPE